MYSASSGGGGGLQYSQRDSQRELFQTMECCTADDQGAMREGFQLDTPMKKSF